MKNRNTLFLPSAKSKSAVLPQSIDVDEIFKKNPPKHRYVNRDDIIFLVTLLYRKSFYHDGYFTYKKDGYIPLRMEYLRDFNRHIRYSLQYLIAIGIVKADNSYIKGVVSIGYKIDERYFNGRTRQVEYSSYKYYWKLKQFPNDDFNRAYLLSKFPFLVKPFNDRRIGIDAKKSFFILKKLRDEKIASARISKLPENDIEEIHRSYLRQKEKIIRIIKNDYTDTYGIDTTSFRFHSLITNMKKELRPLLTLDGEPTVSFDLKNSQPFFMLLFFKNEAYLKYEKTSILRLNTINSEYTKHVQKVIRSWRTPLMMANSSETIDNTGFDLVEFIGEVKKGTLYESLLEKKYGVGIRYDTQFQKKRKVIKRQFISYLYDIDREVGSGRSIRSLFKKHFPTVYNILSDFKAYETAELAKVQDGYDFRSGRRVKKFKEVDSGFKTLAIFLQTIESRVILDICCRRIAELFPEMSFLTVHDCIIVPKSYQESVYGLITDLITRAVGNKPIIEKEA